MKILMIISAVSALVGGVAMWAGAIPGGLASGTGLLIFAALDGMAIWLTEF